MFDIFDIFDIIEKSGQGKTRNAGLASIAGVEENRVISFILPMTTVEASVQALNGLLQRLGPTAHRCGAGEALGVDSAQIYSGLSRLMHRQHSRLHLQQMVTYDDNAW